MALEDWVDEKLYDESDVSDNVVDIKNLLMDMEARSSEMLIEMRFGFIGVCAVILLSLWTVIYNLGWQLPF